MSTSVRILGGLTLLLLVQCGGRVDFLPEASDGGVGVGGGAVAGTGGAGAGGAGAGGSSLAPCAFRATSSMSFGSDTRAPAIDLFPNGDWAMLIGVEGPDAFDGAIPLPEFGYVAARLTSEFEFEWSGVFDDGYIIGHYFSDVSTDDQGNMYVSGLAYNQLQLPDGSVLPGSSDELTFVSRLNAEGNLVWTDLRPGWLIDTEAGPDGVYIASNHAIHAVTPSYGPMLMKRLADVDWEAWLAPPEESVLPWRLVASAGGVTLLGASPVKEAWLGDAYLDSQRDFLASFSTDGALVWVQSFAPDQRVYYTDLTEGGDILLSGSIDTESTKNSSLFGHDLPPGGSLIAALDAQGRLLWTYVPSAGSVYLAGALSEQRLIAWSTPIGGPDPQTVTWQVLREGGQVCHEAVLPDAGNDFVSVAGGFVVSGWTETAVDFGSGPVGPGGFVQRFEWVAE